MKLHLQQFVILSFITYFCLKQITKYLNAISHHSSVHVLNIGKAYAIGQEVAKTCQNNYDITITIAKYSY